MSKKKIILIVISILVAIAVILGVVTIIVLWNLNNKRNYEIEKIDKYSYFILKSADKYGVIDTKGNTIIDAKYENIIIPNPTKDVFFCSNNESIEIVNSNNENILTQYESVEPIKLKNIASDLIYEKTILKYKSEGKFGIIDFSGKPLTEAIYEQIDSVPYKEGELLVKQNGKYGVININGYKMVNTQYDEIISDDYYTEEHGYKLAGYIVGIKTDEGFKYGYINTNGKLKLNTEYNQISRVTNKEDSKQVYLIARKNGQYGLIKDTKEILPYEYQSIEYNHDKDIFIVEKTKKYGVSNSDGQIIIPIQNNSIDVKGIYIYAKRGENRYVYNEKGEIIDIDFDKTIVNTYNDQYKITILEHDNKNLYGVIDSNNKQIINEKYLYLEYAYNNYFIVCGENGKLGVIDDKDNIILEFKYDLLQKLQDKDMLQAVILETNTNEIYSSNLEKVLEIDNASIDIEKDYVRIYSDTELKYLDNNGTQIDNVDILTNKLFANKVNDKWGFIDKQNNIKVDAKYDKVSDFNKYGYASIRKDGKWGSIDEEGNIIVEPTYKLSSSSEPDFIGKYYKVKQEFGQMYYTDYINE